MMSKMKTKTSTLFLLASLALGLMAVSCDKKPPQPTTQSAKHYHLKGKIVSIDKQGKMLNVDSESIPGFMDAMTMPYKVKPESELDKLHSGDAITADLLVQDEGAWLENIAVTGHSPASSSK
jgi:protein SCO1